LKPVTALPPPSLQTAERTGVPELHRHRHANDRRLHASTTMLGHVEARQNNTTIYRNPRSGRQFAHAALCMSTPTRGSNDRCTQPFGWQEWREATQQARPMASDNDFIPATSRAQESTISHISTPSNFIVQPYKAVASYACRSVLEEVTERGWCASKLGLGPEYPGLQYESENKE
jgi:hypothetical protein